MDNSRITARYLYGHLFSFEASHTLMATTNYIPTVNETFKERIKANETGQHDAIVTWVIEGALRYYTNPDTALTLTAKLVEDTRSWRAGSDHIVGAWEDVIMPDDPDKGILVTELLMKFNDWLKSRGSYHLVRQHIRVPVLPGTDTSRRVPRAPELSSHLVTTDILLACRSSRLLASSASSVPGSAEVRFRSALPNERTRG